MSAGLSDLVKENKVQFKTCSEHFTCLEGQWLSSVWKPQVKPMKMVAHFSTSTISWSYTCFVVTKYENNLHFFKFYLMCKITWFINDRKSRVTNSILTALAIQASNSQNTLPRCNFHSPRKMPLGPSPFTRLLWIVDQFYFFIIIFIINFWHFLETFSYMYFQILGELHSLGSKDPYFSHVPSSDLMHYS